MAEVVKFEVQGLKQLGEKLAQMSDEMADKIARRSASAGARLIRDAARRNAPVDTGNLKAAIVYKYNRKSTLTAGYNVATRVGTTRDIKAAKAGTGALGKDAWYAFLLEYGTVKMAPRPFMGPALDSNAQKATNVMKEKLEELINKEWAKNGT